jgi:hypothetical protein
MSFTVHCTEEGPNYSDVISDIKKRADAQNGKNWIEPADAVLNLRSQTIRRF